MATTVIGNSIIIDGEITGNESLVVQGTVKGRIHLKNSLIVDESGAVEAEIETQNVEISGRVTGNITAVAMVELKNRCRMVGDIRAPRILMVDGSSYKGSIDMDAESE